MVFCAIIVDCGNRTERDKGSFSKIKNIRKREGPEERTRSEERVPHSGDPRDFASLGPSDSAS